MKKLVYTMLVALVGSPPAIAQSDGIGEETELTAEGQVVDDTAKPEDMATDTVMLSVEEAAENDAAKADLGEGEEDAKPGEE